MYVAYVCLQMHAHKHARVYLLIFKNTNQLGGYSHGHTHAHHFAKICLDHEALLNERLSGSNCHEVLLDDTATSIALVMPTEADMIRTRVMQEGNLGCVGLPAVCSSVFDGLPV